MDFIWILVAFLCGFCARQIGLPPLVGYLLAGFGLHAAGVEAFSGLETLTNLGITLLLFTIGLKVNLRDLVKTEVLAGASSHILLWSLAIAALLLLLSTFISVFLVDLRTALFYGFALSFSSTVCVMKTLEAVNEIKTRHGDLSIGLLVIQDIVAVLFLAIAAGSAPSPWAILLILAPLLRPLLYKLIERSGHGELLVLVGFFLALGTYETFELLGVKGDLGALFIGMMIAGSNKSNEIYKALTGFKDLFLIGFFLTIGFSALPTWEMLGWATALVALLPFKFLLFFAIFIGFGMRARTALLSGLSLMNFSEFGLIVASYCVKAGWFTESALVIFALAVAISFVLNTFVYAKAHSIYARTKQFICRFERDTANTRSIYSLPSQAEVLIVGMGRVGTGAYRALAPDMGDGLWGIEADTARVEKQKQENINVVYGDADDIDFWEQMSASNVSLIMLAIPSTVEMKNVLSQLEQINYQGKVAAVARYADEREELLELGASVVFNYYSEVGAGFAEECAHLFEPLK